MARYINPYTDFEFKKIFVFIAFIQIFLVEYSPFSAQELKKSNLILVAEFSPTEGEANLSMGQELQSEFLRKISNSGFQAQKSTRATLSSRLEEARSLNALYLVEGNYERSSLTSNLNLYLQIFDPDSGQLVDAYSLNDDVYSIEGLKLDPNELKEDDKIRIQKFSTKGTLNIKTNPTKKERRDNIDQYIAGTKFGSKFKPYIRSEEKASVEALENVFDLLKGQITTSTTKTAKKTNEAPNIVSVITDKQIHDFGRISINDILYQLPGFAPGQINERRTVSSRGLYEGWNNNHLLMLVDGVQQNELFYGSALTWEITPLNMIKSLEVIRGPGSALYGSNATNGVISINTYSGSDLKGRMTARARVGDYGTRIYDLITGNTGKMFSYVLSYNSYETNGNEFSNYDGSGRTDAFGFLQKFSYKDARKNHYLFTKLEGEENLKGFSFQYHRQNWNYQTYNGWLQNIPDSSEKLAEGRDTFIFKYSKNLTDKLQHEYVLKYGTNYWDYNANLYPPGNDFTYGLRENVKTSLDNLFFRAQLTYLFSNGGSFVGGIEANRISYLGDKFHTSNADLNLLGTGETNPNNLSLPLNPIMDWITDRPILKAAPFAQVTTGKLLDKKMELTFGIRYDESANHFRGIDIPYKNVLGVPSVDVYDPISDSTKTHPIPSKFLGPPYVTNEKKTYRKTSPRAGLVIFLTDRLTVKLMAGRAFREPSPGELYGVNTYIGGSNNPRRINPEIIKTMEAGLDWTPNSNWNLRLNGFQTRFENVIDYSGISNAILNVYTQGQKGIESEILFHFQNINGFINYSRFVRFIDSNLDATISTHPKEITLAPASRANLGISGNWQNWQAAFSLERQGMIARRRSDLGPIEPITGILLENTYSNPYSYPVYRPQKVPAWFNLNLRFAYKINEDTQIALNITNALDNVQHLIQRANYPFDYIRDGRRVMIDFQASF